MDYYFVPLMVFEAELIEIHLRNISIIFPLCHMQKQSQILSLFIPVNVHDHLPVNQRE